jgi:hypothetical protein
VFCLINVLNIKYHLCNKDPDYDTLKTYQTAKTVKMGDHVVDPQMHPAHSNNYKQTSEGPQLGRGGHHAEKTIRSHS